jgi:hypothetical protein
LPVFSKINKTIVDVSAMNSGLRIEFSRDHLNMMSHGLVGETKKCELYSLLFCRKYFFVEKRRMVTTNFQSFQFASFSKN